MSARQAILPFFIPMSGCSYRCVYCDQRGISGEDAPPAPAQIEAAALAYAGPRPAQLAFYGGSFTALPRDTQQMYLRAAAPALQRGIIDSLRISTRPDAIDAAGLAFLAGWGVRTVELGIQSFDAQVLKNSGRAYSPEVAQRACLLVCEAGLELGLQLMTGLPGDSRALSLRSMRQACALKPSFMRIYPTLVLSGTPLAELYARGEYQPQTLAEAAALAGDMLAVAEERGIAVIRLGLNPSPSLEAAVLAGPYHPAFGQMAKGSLKLAQACMLLNRAQEPRLLRYPAAERPLLYGQKNLQWRQMEVCYPGLVAEPALLPPGALQAIFSNSQCLTLGKEEFLSAYIKLL